MARPIIRKMSLPDLDEAVELHVRSLPEGALYRLGKRVLRCFYAELVKDPMSFVLGCYDKKKLVGVAASTKNMKEIIQKTKRNHRLALASAVLKRAVVSPVFIARLFLSDYSPESMPELAFLFVDPMKRGSGIGKSLVNRTTKEFVGMKVSSYKITISKSNIRGKKFYEKNEFHKAGSFEYAGEWRDVYVHTSTLR